MSIPNTTDHRLFAQRCANCGFDNEPGRTICQNCGIPLDAAPALTQANMTTAAKRAGSGISTLALKKRTCPECGHDNLPAAPRCSRCGVALDISDLFDKSRSLTAAPAPASLTPVQEQAAVIPALTTHEVRAIRTADAQRLDKGALLRFEIAGYSDTISLQPSPESIIGRRDPISNSTPEVDLTNFAAYRMGISRRHAALRVIDQVVELLDLGSSNGTFVNGQRLNPHQPCPLRSGDEIGLGRMVLHIHFQPPGKGGAQITRG